MCFGIKAKAGGGEVCVVGQRPKLGVGRGSVCRGVKARAKGGEVCAVGLRPTLGCRKM